MKILKSGIEMTPEELTKSKAGKTCACGCEGTYRSEQLWIIADERIECQCGCTSADKWYYPEVSARLYPY